MIAKENRHAQLQHEISDIVGEVSSSMSPKEKQDAAVIRAKFKEVGFSESSQPRILRRVLYDLLEYLKSLSAGTMEYRRVELEAYVASLLYLESTKQCFESKPVRQLATA